MGSLIKRNMLSGTVKITNKIIITCKQGDERRMTEEEIKDYWRTAYCNEKHKKEELESQIEKMKYALKKIIKTVQNDNISSYGERLVIIYNIASEVL